MHLRTSQRFGFTIWMICLYLKQRNSSAVLISRFSAVSLEGHTIHQRFQPWPLHTEIFPKSLNLFTTLCSVGCKIVKFFIRLCWEIFLISNWLRILSGCFAQSGELLLIFAATAPLIDSPFISSHGSLTCCQFFLSSAQLFPFGGCHNESSASI